MYLLPYDACCYEIMFHYEKLMIYVMIYNMLSRVLKVHGGLSYESSKLINLMMFMHSNLSLHDLKCSCMYQPTFTLCPNF